MYKQYKQLSKEIRQHLVLPKRVAAIADDDIKFALTQVFLKDREKRVIKNQLTQLAQSVIDPRDSSCLMTVPTNMNREMMTVGRRFVATNIPGNVIMAEVKHVDVTPRRPLIKCDVIERSDQTERPPLLDGNGKTCGEEAVTFYLFGANSWLSHVSHDNVNVFSMDRRLTFIENLKQQ
jgi:hypothetical protein